MHITEKDQKCRQWKMAKNAYPEIARTEFKFTHWKMAENTHLENGRTENAQHGKRQKIHILENGRKYTPGK